MREVVIPLPLTSPLEAGQPVGRPRSVDLISDLNPPYMFYETLFLTAVIAFFPRPPVAPEPPRPSQWRGRG
jgi:hypothetical protein